MPVPFNKDNIKPMEAWERTSDKIKEWTTDAKVGDNQYGRMENGKLMFPVWKTQSEVATNPIQARADELSNPNSAYYKSIGKQIRSQLTGAMSPNSLLGLMIAAGGSPIQAQQQIKAMEGRIGDTTGTLLNNYFLSASGQANQLLGMVQQNAQFNQNINFQKDMYKQQKSDSILNQGLGIVGGLAGTILGGPIGGAIGAGLAGLFGRSELGQAPSMPTMTNTNIGQSSFMTSWNNQNSGKVGLPNLNMPNNYNASQYGGW